MHKNGLLFFRLEISHEKGLGLLLSAGLSVADLGDTLSKRMLRSKFIPNSRLQIAWLDNLPLERFLESQVCKIIKMCTDIEHLKLMARSLSASGFHAVVFTSVRLKNVAA